MEYEMAKKHIVFTVFFERVIWGDELKEYKIAKKIVIFTIFFDI